MAEKSRVEALDMMARFYGSLTVFGHRTSLRPNITIRVTGNRSPGLWLLLARLANCEELFIDELVHP